MQRHGVFFYTEIGKKYDQKNGWFITPNAQINYTYVKGAEYTTSSGIRVEQDNIQSVIGRLGIYGGRKVGSGSHYIKAAILHEFLGDYGAWMQGADTSLYKSYEGNDTWLEVGFGGTQSLDRRGENYLYYDFKKTFGGEFETNWQVSVGVRHAF